MCLYDDDDDDDGDHHHNHRLENVLIISTGLFRCLKFWDWVQETNRRRRRRRWWWPRRSRYEEDVDIDIDAADIDRIAMRSILGLLPVPPLLAVSIPARPQIVPLSLLHISRRHSLLRLLRLLVEFMIQATTSTVPGVSMNEYFGRNRCRCRCRCRRTKLFTKFDLMILVLLTVS